MKLTIVGCSGTFPGPKDACSSYLLEHDGYRLLLDAGNGSTGALQRTVGLLDLDAVLISHMHGDHFLDLVTYTYARRYHPQGNPGCLPVHGPSDVADHVAAAFGRPVKELLDEVYEFHPAAGPGVVDLGPFHIERDPALGEPRHRFLTTGDPDGFQRIGRRFLGPEMDSAQQFAWVGA